MSNDIINLGYLKQILEFKFFWVHFRKTWMKTNLHKEDTSSMT